jgi:hypothetical protein
MNSIINHYGLILEPVVTVTYNVKCPVHGLLAIKQDLVEAESYYFCWRCSEEDVDKSNKV